MIFVDSSVWIDYFNGKITPETDYLDRLLGNKAICIGDIVLTEVLQGFSNDKDFKTASELMSAFPIVNVLTPQLAIKSAQNFRALRKKGITVRKTIDSIIATYCIEHKLPLLHTDKDFIAFHQHLKLKNALNKN